MAQPRSPQKLLDLFARETVVDLVAIRAALGDASAMTAFRYLRRVPYRRSYNHNGRYYTLHDALRYDRIGLWSHGDIHFSVDGSLKATVARFVREAQAGLTHQELQERLRVRVQQTLRDLLREGAVARERLIEVFVYLHSDLAVRAEQVRQRKKQVAAAATAVEIQVADLDAIRILLVLIRYPGSQPADVVRHLRGLSPPIKFGQVRAVFVRYDIGEKRGPRIF
jgi:hypothetical protein